MGGQKLNKERLLALDSWQTLKSGSFITIVKSEVTVDVFGYDSNARCWKPHSVSASVFHISYGVGSALLVLRCDGYARCLRFAGRVTSTDPALFLFHQSVCPFGILGQDER